MLNALSLLFFSLSILDVLLDGFFFMKGAFHSPCNFFLFALLIESELFASLDLLADLSCLFTPLYLLVLSGKLLSFYSFGYRLLSLDLHTLTYTIDSFLEPFQQILHSVLRLFCARLELIYCCLGVVWNPFSNSFISTCDLLLNSLHHVGVGIFAVDEFQRRLGCCWTWSALGWRRGRWSSRIVFGG